MEDHDILQDIRTRRPEPYSELSDCKYQVYPIISGWPYLEGPDGDPLKNGQDFPGLLMSVPRHQRGVSLKSW